MKTIFLDPNRQTEFQEKGFTRLNPVSESTLRILQDGYAYYPRVGSIGGSRYIYINDLDPAKALQGFQLLKTYMLKELRQQMSPIDGDVFTYFVKEPRCRAMPIHQDTTVTEPLDEYPTLEVILALSKIGLEDGPPGFIPTSQNWYSYPVPTPTPLYPNGLNQNLDSLYPFIEFVTLNPGEMVVFDTRVFHNSVTNKSDKDRVTVFSRIFHKEAPLRLYYIHPCKVDTLLKYAIDPDFTPMYRNADLLKMYDSKKLIYDYPIVDENVVVYPPFDLEYYTKMAESKLSRNQLY